MALREDTDVDVDVTTTTRIARPRELVASFAGDPTNAPRWYANIRSVRWRTPPPLAVGSQLDFVARFLGRELAYTYEVVTWRPGEELVMRTSQGPFPMETTYRFEDDGPDGTRVTLRNRGRPAGFASLGAPLLAASVRAANRKDLARLRGLLEGDADPVG